MGHIQVSGGLVPQHPAGIQDQNHNRPSALTSHAGLDFQDPELVAPIDAVLAHSLRHSHLVEALLYDVLRHYHIVFASRRPYT